MMVRYVDSLDGISENYLTGFFVGWPNPASPETHLALLLGSDIVLLAIDEESERVVGYVTALTDNVMNAHITFLEVLPDWQHQGIGSELVRRMLEKLSHLYAVSLGCDKNLQPFYTHFEFKPALAMSIWRYNRQSGKT